MSEIEARPIGWIGVLNRYGYNDPITRARVGDVIVVGGDLLRVTSITTLVGQEETVDLTGTEDTISIGYEVIARDATEETEG